MSPCCLLQFEPPDRNAVNGHDGNGRDGTAAPTLTNETTTVAKAVRIAAEGSTVITYAVHACVRVCVRASVRPCLFRACVCACMCACAGMHTSVHAYMPGERDGVGGSAEREAAAGISDIMTNGHHSSAPPTTLAAALPAGTEVDTLSSLGSTVLRPQPHIMSEGDETRPQRTAQYSLPAGRPPSFSPSTHL